VSAPTGAARRVRPVGPARPGEPGGSAAWSAVAAPAYAAPLPAVERLRVAADEGGFTAAARVYVDPDHPILRGHFPGLPLYPGVFVVETLCQAMTEALRAQGRTPRLRTVRSLRLTAALRGTDELTLTMDVRPRDGGWVARAVGRRRDGVTAASVHAIFDEGGAA
jgi:3-hydroxyacyl-[acyl-carrier-protein] dehydratase